MSFPETLWSAIDEARALGGGLARRRLGEFLSQYRTCIYEFIRARGRTTADADDLTQEFMMKVWERDLLLHADAERGRLRTFLLSLLARFLSDQSLPRRRKQSAFELKMKSTGSDDNERENSPAASALPTAEEAFMRNWAKSVVRHVHDRTRTTYVAENKSEWYDIFLEVFASPETTQEDLAGRFKKSRDQIRYAVERVKETFLHELRDAIVEQLRDPREAEQEMREVLRLAALADDDSID